MPSNPMQRKARNAFLLGLLVMLLIILVGGAVAFFLVIDPKIKKKKKEKEQIYAIAYRIKENKEVKSGEEISENVLEKVEIPVASEKVKTDFVKISDLTREFQDEDGEFYTENKYKSKVNLKEGTILTYSMLYEKEKMQDSLRYVEYNMITMPTTLDIGNYIDIRLRLPNAQDLIVITKKEIVNIYDTTVGLYLTEEEIVLLNSAIVEAYIMTSSELYMATYVEPGMQGQAIYTYSPTAEVVALIQSNQNIVFEAREAIVNRYNGSGAVRNPINNSLGQYAEEAKGNVEQGMQEQIEAARKAREDYLSELNGY